MAVCPKCKQEYEAWVKRCPDCEVDFAAAAAQSPGEAAAAFVALDAKACTRITAILEASKIGFRLDRPEGAMLPEGAAIVLVPQAVAKPLQQALEGELELAAAPAPAGMSPAPAGTFRAAPPKHGDLVSDPPLLREPAARILARGSEVLPELLDLVRRGDDDARQNAVRMVLAFKAPGVAALAAELPRLARETRAEALFLAAQRLRDVKAPPAALDSLLALACDERAGAEPRSLALHVLARSEHLAFGMRIAPLLDDQDELVREAADDALCNLADDDVGFDPGLPAAERKPFVARWIALLESRAAR